MEPDRDWKGRATLVDLLDRIFDKGVIIHLDLIISVAGIPLIGVNLRAALAGMETMLQYGMMQDMDVKTRMWEAQHRENKPVPLLEGEEVVLEMFGSYYYMKGIYNAWKSGKFYLTKNRLFLYQQDISEIVFGTPLNKIKAMGVIVDRSFTGKDRNIIYLHIAEKGVVRLSVLDTKQFKQNLEQLLENAGVALNSIQFVEEFDNKASQFLIEGEKIVCKGKMWYLTPGSGIIGETWKPGYLYLTNKTLYWWYAFENKVILQIPIEEISAATKERRNLSTILKDKKVLDLIYNNNGNGTKNVASFSGKEVDEWEKTINQVLTVRTKVDEGKEKETCPQCGREYLAKNLLEKGCPNCGWSSPRLKKKILKKKIAQVLKT